MCYRKSSNCSCIFTKQSSTDIAEYVLVVMCAIKSLTHNLRYSCADANKRAKRLLWMLVLYNILINFCSVYMFWAIYKASLQSLVIIRLTNFQNSLNLFQCGTPKYTWLARYFLNQCFMINRESTKKYKFYYGLCRHQPRSRNKKKKKKAMR